MAAEKGVYNQPLKSNGTGVVPSDVRLFIGSQLKNQFLIGQVEASMEQSPPDTCAIALLTRGQVPHVLQAMKRDGDLIEVNAGEYECHVTKACVNCGLLSALQLIDLGLGA